MKRLIFLTITFFQTLGAFEWLDCNVNPIPQNQFCIFYDSMVDSIFFGYPEIYISLIGKYEVCITHWMLPPEIILINHMILIKKP